MKTLSKILIAFVLLMISIWIVKFVFYITVGLALILLRLIAIAIPVVLVSIIGRMIWKALTKK